MKTLHPLSKDSSLFSPAIPRDFRDFPSKPLNSITAGTQQGRRGLNRFLKEFRFVRGLQGQSMTSTTQMLKLMKLRSLGLTPSWSLSPTAMKNAAVSDSLRKMWQSLEETEAVSTLTIVVAETEPLVLLLRQGKKTYTHATTKWKRMHRFYLRLRSFYLQFVFPTYCGGTVSKKDQIQFPDRGGAKVEQIKQISQL